MMSTLNYKQLAFILNVEPIEALRKIIFVHCKVKGKQVPPQYHLIRDYLFKDSPWPQEMSIALLSEHLNLPDLQSAVDDIHENYLKRQGSKKYILFDYPEKELRTKLKEKVRLPSVLATMLKDEDVNTIETEWNKRYGITF